MIGGLGKVGWVWTKAGWKQTPKRLQAVKKVATPPKRRPFKKVAIKPAERHSVPTFAEARKLAVEQGMAVSAPIPAPEATTPAMHPPRRAWGGKYDQLAHAGRGDFSGPKGAPGAESLTTAPLAARAEPQGLREHGDAPPPAF